LGERREILRGREHGGRRNGGKKGGIEEVRGGIEADLCRNPDARARG